MEVPLKRVLGLAALLALWAGLPTTSAAASAKAARPAGVHPAAVANPTIHYTFDTDLLDTYSNSTLTTPSACPADPCNSAASFGSDVNGKYWTWTSTALRGGGFTIDTTADIGSTYTIALKFSFDTVTSWRKIIDYKNRVSDNGFYYYGSKLQFYPYTSQTSVTTYPANTVLDLVAVRKATGASTGTFTVYAVGADNTLTQIFVANDTNNDSVPHTYGSPTKTKLGFFFDDLATSSEATASGKVYDLRIWSNTEMVSSDLQTQVVKPAAPGGVTASPSNGAVTINWNSTTNASSYIGTAGGQTCTVTAPATTCTVTGLTNGQSVNVTVQAVGPGGYSSLATVSNVVVGAAATTTTAAASGAAATTTTVAGNSAAATTTTVATAASGSTATATPTVGSSPDLPKSGTGSARLALLGLLLVVGGLTSVRRARATA